jgi:hypothetical protein
MYIIVVVGLISTESYLQGKSMARKSSRVLELVVPAGRLAGAPNGQAYRPFPVELLPDPVGEFVRQGASAVGCDAACLAVPLLAVLAAAIGNTRTICLKWGRIEPCVVWSAVINDGQTRMSAALRTAVQQYFDRQNWEFETFRRQREVYLEKISRWGGPKKHGKNQWSIVLGEAPQPPVLKRFLWTQTAVDKLAAMLELNPRGLLVVREELNGWWASFLRTTGAGAGRDPGVWLEMHRAGPLYFERTCGNREVFFVPRAALSLTGVFSPGILVRVLKADVPARELVASFLLAMPPRMPAEWSPARVDEATDSDFDAALCRLTALQMKDFHDGRVPLVLTPTPPAMAAWAAFYNECDAEQATAKGPLQAAFARLEAYAARLALIHHVVRLAGNQHDDQVPVELESMQAGVTLSRWFKAETERVYGQLLQSADERNAETLVEMIRKRGGRISVRELMRSYTQRYVDVASAESALEKLVELGLGRWIEPCEKKLPA